MKGGNITIENIKDQFVVFKIEENKDSGKAEIAVAAHFSSKVDADRFKEAKESIERLSPRFDWIKTSFRVQQVFYKSFVDVEKSA